MNLAVRVSRGTCWVMADLLCYTVGYISAFFKSERKNACLKLEPNPIRLGYIQQLDELLADPI